jgi:hypothetical protein
VTFKPEHLDPKTYTKDRNQEIAHDNNRILQGLLKDVPHDNKDHKVELRVRWEGYTVIIKNKGLKVDGEDIGETR